MNRSPNILLILSDEHTRNVAGFSGDRVVRTENLDKLAARGMRFDAVTCSSPVCTPSRMSMLTGKEPHRCAGWSNHWIIYPEHRTWPEHFAAHGYMTALVGKMHFGGKDQMQGFQHRPYGDLRHGLGHQPDPLHMYPGYANPESAGVTEIPESLLQDVVVTRESLGLLLEHHDRSPDVPWLLCASYSRPHSPLTAPGRYFRRYLDKVPPPEVASSESHRLDDFSQRLHFELTEEQTMRARAGYYACVDFLDDCIGELVDGLEKAGMLENTKVIYTSDHGEMLGNYGCWGKCLYYEPSLGVPMVVRGPGVAEGQAFKHPISLMDLYPTACALAGLPVPEGLDGIDFSGVLADPETSNPPRNCAPSAFYQYGIRIDHGRIPDDTPMAAWRTIRQQQWKYAEVEQSSAQLFDLADDPLELTNLAGNADQADRCQRMRDVLYENFSWPQIHEQLERDHARLSQFASGLSPGTPNQYMLPSGRVFDAEKALYDARWLPVPPGCTGGIIPQQFG